MVVSTREEFAAAAGEYIMSLGAWNEMPSSTSERGVKAGWAGGGEADDEAGVSFEQATIRSATAHSHFISHRIDSRGWPGLEERGAHGDPPSLEATPLRLTLAGAAYFRRTKRQPDVACLPVARIARP